MPRVRALPQNPSLEQLKNQAKDLLGSLHEGEPRAWQRFGRCFDLAQTPLDAFKMTQAQLVLAREQGFSSWHQLSAWVADRTLPTAAAQLVQLLGARTFHVRAAAAVQIESLGKAGVDAALAGLAHPDPRVRRGAAAFMDHHADLDCVPRLTDMALNDPVAYVRDMALHALDCQRCKPELLRIDANPIHVLRAKTDANWKRRRSAVWTLAQRREFPGVKEALHYVAEHDPDPRVAAAASWGLLRKQPGAFHARENKLRRLAMQKAAENQEPVTAA